MRITRVLLYFFAVFFLVCGGFIPSVFAHKLVVTVWTEGSTAMVEGAFGDGSAAANCPVKVYRQNDVVLLEGKTDEEGLFSFPVPIKADLKIVLNAGMGHVADTVLPVGDISSIAGEEQTAQPTPEETQTASVAKVEAQPVAATAAQNQAITALPQLNKQDVQLIVDKSLKKQFRPVMEQLTSRKFTDILAGIGYILGLVGVASYFHYRSKMKNLS